MARIAAELLGADEEEGDRVRLYQSCVFVKPPGFGETNWHSDANMVRRTRRHPRRHRMITFTSTYLPNSTHALTICAHPPLPVQVPLDTNRFITLWLPLRPLEEDDAALVFASGSHRDFSLPYWHTLEGIYHTQIPKYQPNTFVGN